MVSGCMFLIIMFFFIPIFLFTFGDEILKIEDFPYKEVTLLLSIHY